MSGAIRLQSQTAVQFEKAADHAFHMKDFYSAFVYYKESLKRKVKEEVKLKSAIAAYEYGAINTSKDIIEELISVNASYRIESLELYYGFCLFASGDYKAAKHAMNKYLTKVWMNKKRSNIDLAHDYIKKCDSAMYYSSMAGDDPLAVWKYSSNLNSSKADFAYAEYKNRISFSSTRRNSILLIADDSAIKYIRPKGMQAKQELVFFEQFNDETAFTCLCRAINQLDRHCHLYLWNLTDNKLEELNGFFKDPFISVSQPFVDGKNGLLYFSASQKDGEGGKDIYSIPLDSLNTNYKPLPVEVNTADNEESPFVLDGVLYFSSDRDKGLGGYDIYSYRLDKKSPVENLGASYNSSYDERYFRIYDEREFISSNRPIDSQVSIEDVNCLNIYIRSKLQKEDIPIDISEELITEVPAENEDKANPSPVPIEEETPSEYHLELDYKAVVYFPNDIPLVNSAAEYEYESCYEEYTSLIDYYMNSCPEMDDFDSFYASEVVTGFQALKDMKSGAQQYLDKGKSITIVINAFTSPRASDSYNLALSDRRCKSVLTYLMKDNEELRQFFKEKKLTIECNTFGERLSPPMVSEDYFDPKSSVFSIAASRERRVECIMRIDQ